MTKMTFFPLLFALLLPLGCASYDAKRNQVDIAPIEFAPGILSSVGDVKKMRQERETLKRGMIHFSCVAFYANDPLEHTRPCETTGFSLLNATGKEVIRKFPNHEGKIEFPVASGQAYRIKSEASKSWKVEQEPTGDIKSGDTVRVVLRR